MASNSHTPIQLTFEKSQLGVTNRGTHNMVNSDANTPGPYPPHQEQARIAKRKVLDRRMRSHESRPYDHSSSVNPEAAASKNAASAYPRNHWGSHPVSLAANPGIFP